MNKHLKGAMVAAAVAGLFLSGTAVAAEPASGGSAKVKCDGGNDCKAKGQCGGSTHDCAGKNACKGKGWVMTSEADCTAKGGKVTK